MALIELESPGAPTEYRLGLRNFYVLTRYNRSVLYASAVYDLAQEIKAKALAGQDGGRYFSGSSGVPSLRIWKCSFGVSASVLPSFGDFLAARHVLVHLHQDSRGCARRPC